MLFESGRRLTFTDLKDHTGDHARQDTPIIRGSQHKMMENDFWSTILNLLWRNQIDVVVVENLRIL